MTHGGWWTTNGGCGARAVSRKAPIFFINIVSKYSYLVDWQVYFEPSAKANIQPKQTLILHPGSIGEQVKREEHKTSNKTLFTLLDKCGSGIDHWHLVIERAIAVLGEYFCSLTSVLFIALMNYWAVSFIGVYCPPQCHIWAALQRLSSRLNEDQWPDKTKMEMAL